MNTKNNYSKGLYLYPVWVRIWHLINALLIVGLVITGINLQFSGEAKTFIKFDLAVSLHNLLGILLAVNYVFFFIGNLLTKNKRHYKIQIKGIVGGLKKQALYYAVGIFKHEEHPFPISENSKFNPLQHISYVFVMYLFVPIVIFSGFGLFFPESIVEKVFGFSGLFLTDLLHIITGFVISIFLIIHIYICTIGHSISANFKSMITGWHEIH